MKKFLIIISVFLILVSTQPQKSFTLNDYFSGEYTSYTSKASCNESVNLGFCYMQEKVVDKEILVGESLKIYNFEPINALKMLSAKVIKTEYLENGTVVIYAYTNLIARNVEIDNKRVNIQIAQSDDYTIIGWPLIYGSF